MKLGLIFFASSRYCLHTPQPQKRRELLTNLINKNKKLEIIISAPISSTMSSSLSTLSPFSSSSSSFSLLPPKTLNPTELSFRAPGARPDSRPFFSCSPRRSKTLIRAPTSRSAAETSSPAAAATAQQGSTASDVVREFYDRINRRDLDGLEVLIGEDCVYEDLVFSRPFVGRKVDF